MGQPAWRSTSRWRVWSAAGVTAAAAAALTAFGTGVANRPDETPEPQRVLTVGVRAAEAQTSYQVGRDFVGRVEARRRGGVGFERAGLIAAVHVREGQRVKKGQTLATIDTAVLLARRRSRAAQLRAAEERLKELRNGPRPEVIEAARAEVERAESQNRFDRAELKRASGLMRSGSVDRQRYDRAFAAEGVSRAQIAAAKARLDELENGTRAEVVAAQDAAVEQARAELKSVDVDLEKSKLMAPFAGVVGRRHRDEGAVVMAGDAVVDLYEMGHLEAHVGVAGPAADRLHAGESRRVLVNGRLISAEVAAVRPDRQASTRAVIIVFTLKGDLADIKDGDVARLGLTRAIKEDGYWLPIGSLTEGVRGLWACLVARPLPAAERAGGATHRLIRRDLELLHQTADRAYVRGTLRPGDLVVVGGRQRVVAGLKVRLADGNP